MPLVAALLLVLDRLCHGHRSCLCQGTCVADCGLPGLLLHICLGCLVRPASNVHSRAGGCCYFCSARLVCLRISTPRVRKLRAQRSWRLSYNCARISGHALVLRTGRGQENLHGLCPKLVSGARPRWDVRLATPHAGSTHWKPAANQTRVRLLFPMKAPVRASRGPQELSASVGSLGAMIWLESKARAWVVLTMGPTCVWWGFGASWPLH